MSEEGACQTKRVPHGRFAHQGGGKQHWDCYNRDLECIIQQSAAVDTTKHPASPHESEGRRPRIPNWAATTIMVPTKNTAQAYACQRVWRKNGRLASDLRIARRHSQG